MKTCRICHTSKPRTDFSKHRDYVDGLDARCRECRRSESRRAYARTRAANRKQACPTCNGNNPTARRHCPDCYAAARKRLSPSRIKALRAKYKITGPDYLWWCDWQSGACQICDKVPEVLCVDHDHATGAVRGLLCAQCNAGLGMFSDDPDRLSRARKYLTGRLAATL